MTAPALALSEGLELASALVARVADDVGARALAIKGRVAEAHELRTPRVSVDVDVLVDPARHDDLVAGLARLGWELAASSAFPSPWRAHSTTLRHPSWPCEVDLHHRFPGFLAEPAEVFEALWEERTFVVAAGLALPAAGLHGATLVMALHALRTPSDPRNATELAGLVERLTARGVDGDRLLETARRTGSLGTAAPFLRELGLEPPEAPAQPLSGPELQQWQARLSVTGTRNLGWLVTLRRTPAWRRPLVLPGLLLRVTLSVEPVLRLYYPQAPAGRRGLWLARWWRLRAAVRDLPGAVRVARRLP